MAVIRSDQATGDITFDGVVIGNAYRDAGILSLSEAEMKQLYDAIIISQDQLFDEQGFTTIDGGVQPSQIIEDPVQTFPEEPIPIFAEPEPMEQITTLEGGMAEPGDDLRDSGNIDTQVVAGTIGVVAILARFSTVAASGLRVFFRRFATGAVLRWSSLPVWVRTLLASVGVVVGTDILMDIPGVPGEGSILPLPGGRGGDNGFHPDRHLVDGHLGAHIVGSWTANGVKFYRLSDGKLAVQNKQGRWKVWKPKKPIVLFADGASNLKTMLRADAALNRQAKKIASMLNRRAPRKSRAAPKSDPNVVVLSKQGTILT